MIQTIHDARCTEVQLLMKHDVLRVLPVNEMQGHPENPRTWNDPGLERLGKTMLSVGTVQPVIVRRIAGGDPPYQIVAGERRWRAAKLVGMTHLHVIVRELSEADAFKQMLVENLHRKRLKRTNGRCGMPSANGSP